ncbi:MAG TPA: redox-regulated ATPase YchF [Candidatus Bathyarchaeia archaeon]|nr:MAG: GTPase [Candidatus Bathyarchaeota archaeon RBG_16_48_13]HJX23508.1 redox-regulated ATPase YchF [Candidatus Bathyarchaeia archaeon]
MLRIGIIGKTNTGKTTFFNSATMLSGEMSSYPFTTKQPNIGTSHVQTVCACRELKVRDNPQNSTCIDGWRFIPVELVDLPGLIKDAWTGRGLGNQFLSVAAQADALLHVVDASGSINAEGEITKPGMGNPVIDAYDIEEELVMWFAKAVERNKKRVLRQMTRASLPLDKALSDVLGGFKVRLEQVQLALRRSALEFKDIDKWTWEDIKSFSKEVREVSKPTIIIANKMDLPTAEKNFELMTETFRGKLVIPCCSEAELALRRAEQKGVIKYIPGEEAFRVLEEEELTKEQAWALNYVQDRVLSKFMTTGIQYALNTCIFKLLRMNTIYPVEDAANLSDKKGNVLPDVFLMPNNDTIRDLAAQIHTQLLDTMIHAVDVRTGLRLPLDYVLKDRDIINIVTAARRK